MKRGFLTIIESAIYFCTPTKFFEMFREIDLFPLSAEHHSRRNERPLKLLHNQWDAENDCRKILRFQCFRIPNSGYFSLGCICPKFSG